MYPSKFDYCAVESVDAAIAQLGKHGYDARLLAGGQSLIPMLKLRLMSPKLLVDIGRIPGLDTLEREDGWLAFGALVRHGEVAASAVVSAAMPILSEAAGFIADPQVRNWGTMAGALAEADPSGDWGAVALAVNAELTAKGPKGARTIAARDFFVDAYTTVLEPDEMLTRVRVPVAPAHSGGTYVKFRRRTGDFATASVAVQLTLGPDGAIRSVGVGLGAAATRPLKAEGAEAALLGSRLTEEAIRAACSEIDKVSDPVSDLRGPAHYKKSLLKTLFRRALSEAAQRAGGQDRSR